VHTGTVGTLELDLLGSLLPVAVRGRYSKLGRLDHWTLEGVSDDPISTWAPVEATGLKVAAVNVSATLSAEATQVSRLPVWRQNGPFMNCEEVHVIELRAPADLGIVMVFILSLFKLA
jgi:hypothetical protein